MPETSRRQVGPGSYLQGHIEYTNHHSKVVALKILPAFVSFVSGYIYNNSSYLNDKMDDLSFMIFISSIINSSYDTSHG